MRRWFGSQKPAVAPGAGSVAYGLSRYGANGTGRAPRSAQPGPVRYQAADTLLEYGVVDPDTQQLTRRPLTKGLVAWVNPGGTSEVLAQWDGHRWTLHRRAAELGGDHLVTVTGHMGVLREVVHDPAGPVPDWRATLVSPGYLERTGGRS